MIVPVVFQWMQLNGPQISTISDAIAEYLKNMFDTKLDYLNNLSVETASNDHLTFLGTLAGFVRPNVAEVQKQYFMFSQDAVPVSEHSFSDPSDLTKPHGVLSGDIKVEGDTSILDTEHYRALLRAFIHSEGEIGSLVLLDDICAELSKLDAPLVAPFYRFNFQPEHGGAGDVELELGYDNQWENATHVFSIIRSLADSLYFPVPIIIPVLNESTPTTSPEVVENK